MSWIKEIADPGFRSWEQFYRNRWQHDAVVRSTHGVNCTGGCSWWVYVKDGIVTWEMQALDYPRLEPGLPPYEPRGCQRGISASWYVYSPLRIKHPYVRGPLLDAWREARAAHADPVEAWAAIVGDAGKRAAWQRARGMGGFRRASWDECLDIIAASMLHTAKRYGPDRVIGFSPIPAMSMVSYAGGSRLLQLFGGALLSFYDMYADFPPASPETWGEKTDTAESADWYNSKFIVTVGSNLSMTRTPDVHFAVEARSHGAKLVVVSPDFSQVSKYADWWIPVNAGMDGAFWMAATHVILREFHAERTVPRFADYMSRFSDAPFLVALEPEGDQFAAARFLRAGRIARYAGVEHGDWKCLVFDRNAKAPRMPLGSIGFRWQEKPGQWNLGMKDGEEGADLLPQLTFIEDRDDVLSVRFPRFPGGEPSVRGVPVRYVDTVDGRVPVTTVFDLLMAQYGVSRGLPGDYPADYGDAERAYTPAWQERFTGIGAETVIRFAREWAATAERTGGKCMVIIGSGANHWFHANLIYRAAIAPLVLCGCVGVNGGGLNHYTGQEKCAPGASWATLAMALDWLRPPRLQNGPSFHYVHSDQWRYEGAAPDRALEGSRLGRSHTMDAQVDAVHMGWLPFYPQFDRSPLDVAREAREAGARSDADIVDWVAGQVRRRALRFAVEDPDAPGNWPRVWLIWRANALHASAKGHEYFLRHYLGTSSNAIAKEELAGLATGAAENAPAPEGKMDLVVDLNFRMDTTAMYSDIVLPSAGWYEKNDLNTTDLHSFIHPLGQAVPPCYESRSDWEIFHALAARISALAPAHFPAPVQDVVARPLLHDTPDEIAQPEVRDWTRGECEAIPGRTMPHFAVVERDYANLVHRWRCLGPGLREHGVEERGIQMPVADLYDELAGAPGAYEWNGARFPSVEDAADAANMILRFAPETNGEVAWRGFKAQEQRTGVALADLAERQRGVRYDFEALAAQPRRLLTSPCWSGILNDGRAYAAYVMNVERLVPWRTLTGRQHLYLDHELYRAFGESLPTFKPKIDIAESHYLVETKNGGRSVALNVLTPHGKWHIHTTYYDTLRMLSLSRGIEPLWLNDKDASGIGVADNDWVEAVNDHGVVVTRAVVSARVPRGVCFFYHGPERTVGFPTSPSRGGRRGGGTNSLTRLKLKPVLMAGGYAQHCYRFNDYGPPASDRDSYALVHKLEGPPRW
jgi:nitrate reductase / nitrite oxidoreductase, alpha subunit